MKSAAQHAHRAMNGKPNRRSAAPVKVRKAKVKASRRAGKKRPTERELKKAFVDLVSDKRARWVWLD